MIFTELRVKVTLRTSLTDLIINMIKLKSILIQQYLKKISNSITLSKSVVNKQLFIYLVDQSIKGETPKEYQIAFDVFGKRGDSNKENNIRVYIHNLRKKLTEYYHKEGLDDEIRFEIPKGSYQILFQINRKAYLKRYLYSVSPYILLFSMILLVFASILFFTKDKPDAAKHFIWSELYNSNYPTLIVLGDHYFFQGKSPLGKFTTMRQTSINSEEDFDGLLISHPEIKNDIRKTDLTYINKQAPFGLYKIMNLLGGGQTSIDFQYSSDFRWDHAKNRNLIFVGSFKTQNILKDVHKKIGVEFLTKKTTINFKGKDSVSSYNCGHDGFLTVDYPTITYFKTEDGRNIISFMSSKDIGNYAVLKFLSIPENIKKLSEKVQDLSTSNFRAILEVKGQGETDFEIQVKEVAPITENINEIWPK